MLLRGREGGKGNLFLSDSPVVRGWLDCDGSFASAVACCCCTPQSSPVGLGHQLSSFYISGNGKTFLKNRTENS